MLYFTSAFLKLRKTARFYFVTLLLKDFKLLLHSFLNDGLEIASVMWSMTTWDISCQVQQSRNLNYFFEAKNILLPFVILRIKICFIKEVIFTCLIKKKTSCEWFRVFTSTYFDKWNAFRSEFEKNKKMCM